MSSIRCANCDLVNFANQPFCRRCQAPLSGAFAAAPQEYPALPPDAVYRLPPPAPPGYYHSVRPLAQPVRPPQAPPAPYPNAYYQGVSHQPAPTQTRPGEYAPPSPGYQPYPGQYAYQGGVSGYAQPFPPQAAQTGVWRRYEQVVMRKDAELPNACVKCGTAVNGADKVKLRLYWHHPALYVALISPLIYGILAAALSRRATIYAGLCEQHKDAQRNKLLTSLSLVAGGLAGFIYSLGSGPFELGALSFLIFLAGVIVACFYQPLKAAEIDDTHIWLKGAGQNFTESLPLWEGRALSPYR